MNGQAYTTLCEGCILTAYQDQGGVWTIGYGHTGSDIIENLVWSQDQADSAFSADYAVATGAAQYDIGQDFWGDIAPVRQAALIDMAYEMGRAGLGDFPVMLAAIRKQDWQGAHDACLKSKYATEVSKRANRSAGMLLNGQWPDGYGD